MHHLLKSPITLYLIILNAIFFIPAQAQNLDQRKINLLLNSEVRVDSQDIFSEKVYLDLINKKTDFIKYFPNAKWKVKTRRKNPNGRDYLDVFISGQRKINHLILTLESKQRLLITLSKNKIINYKTIDEYSILKSLDNPLKVDIVVPDLILTGTRYDVDIILEEPLGDNFLAGGLINTDSKDITIIKNPYINLMPLNSGGLFKSVQAPLKPGKQTIAALLVHPKGIIAVTKTINIVSDSNQIPL